MKIISNFFVLSLFCLSIAACSKSETPDTSKVDQNITTERELPFLAENEIPKISTSDHPFDDEFGDLVIEVRLTNQHGSSVVNHISVSPSNGPVSNEHFYTTACRKRVLVLVLWQPVDAGVSTGTSYYNALFDPATGEWITTFGGGEFKDRETGEIITDGQKAVLAKLKVGITHHCPQILDPNNKKAGEQLFQ